MLAALGGARGALALARREPAATLRTAAAAMAAGVCGLAALHAATHFAIARMCDAACATGDMADVAAHWQLPGVAAFFVAEDVATGAVVGSVAVRRGGLEDAERARSDAPLLQPDACSVWKVSTLASARGTGVARALMRAAEAWACDAGAKRIVLMTGSSGAKRFYQRAKYTLTDGSLRGTEPSVWSKTLREEGCKAEDATAEAT